MQKGITPAVLLSAIAVVIMAFGLLGGVMQTQFANVTHTQEAYESTTRDLDKILLDRIIILEAQVARQARDPVEKATLDAIVDAIGKRDDLIQGQITDLNRQIAAALIIIDNNSLPKKPMLPP